MFAFMVIVLNIIVILMVSNPYLVYKILEEWKNIGGNGPSKVYIFNIRFGGVVFIIIGVSCGVIGFLTR